MLLMGLMPMLQTEDIRRTATWYETILGFSSSVQEAKWLVPPYAR